MREVNAPDTLGMLFKCHGLCLLADIPQLDNTFVVTTDQVALHIAVPANTAQLGPAWQVVEPHISTFQCGTGCKKIASNLESWHLRCPVFTGRSSV